MRQILVLALALLVAAATLAEAQGRKFTYVDLIRQLTDLEALAVQPPQGEKSLQASSYDRASVYDPATNTYKGWDANGDGDGIVRVEGDKLVLAEMEGPGVIWRIWSAAPGAGRVRIYLDGAAEPAVDLPFSAYFDGSTEPFIYPSLVHDAASGKNCYVPIPFQKSCKVVADRNWGLYYHFTYTVYPKDTQLPTFSRRLTLEERTALYQANETLTSRLGTDPAGPREGEETIRRSADIAPGKTLTLARLRGPRAITALRVAPTFANREEEVMGLRQMVLRITFDGEQQPAVWAPLGDFFGSVPGLNLYKSLPMGVTSEGMYSFWYMPFGREARVEIVNEGDAARRVAYELTHAPLARPMSELMHFRAKWHRDAFNPTEPGRGIEWTMLTTKGKGRYVGVNLHIWNPKGDWWGEGDEMFYVDGEKFPSTFGTGSEDYFGYAWCNPAYFQNAFHNQPYNSGNNRGHASVNRWHIADNCPFQVSWMGTIEKYFPNERPTLYAATAYWYLTPGGEDPYKPLPLSERVGYFDIHAPPPFRVKGALEGEDLRIVEKTGGNVGPQGMAGFGPHWSGETHLWWTGAKPGDRLVLAVPVEKAGRYDLRAQLTKARDYGIIQIWLNGQKLGEPMDLYSQNVVATGEISLGVVELKAGENRLTLEIVGANEQAVKAYMAGLDYVRLEPAK
jgi:hypothetical protein